MFSKSSTPWPKDDWYTAKLKRELYFDPNASLEETLAYVSIYMEDPEIETVIGEF
jgi:hypothetical protein